jgi:uncharacterized DUF497 family protein
MGFEYDKEKSAANKRKHGIDFKQAQALWEDPDLVEVPVTKIDEPRYLLIGIIGNKHWSAIITYQHDNIRLISVRRSRKEEIEFYEGF